MLTPQIIMKNSPLQLDHSLIEELSIKPGTISEGGYAGQLNLQVLPSYGRANNDPLKWRVELDIQFKSSDEKPAPYEGRIKVVGFFRVMPEYPKEKQSTLVAVNAPSILFSMSREIIAGITARSVNGIFTLPSMSFADTRLPEALMKKLSPSPASAAEANS